MTEPAENWFVEAPGDIHRIEACLTGAAYAPHRHDTYTIGITLSGIQSFTYRGAERASYPGQAVILHPDEKHDGRAGDDAAFRYRAAYISPADIQEALNGRALPFVEGGVSIDARLQRSATALLGDYERPLSRLEYQDGLYDLAIALQAAAGAGVVIKRVNREAAAGARDYIEANLSSGFSLEDLEHATGHCRWQLSRDFRAMFGTSPYRYLILRRLDLARRMMRDGGTIAEIAHECGFSDQSHFGRAFKQAFGLTPKTWLGSVRNSHDRSIRA
ncbi:AraC family transcriptional regulator [Hyphomonas sp. WL0036]|uniref:helix-turn-helix transcriptional regulator n=1 Tax=Hyphomonas sediminis TaxID=2866160 RepID=UPI001C7E2D4B|nr:AraC family transcriptional regulator [Hyphomonas sediminis]